MITQCWFRCTNTNISGNTLALWTETLPGFSSDKGMSCRAARARPPGPCPLHDAVPAGTGARGATTQAPRQPGPGRKGSYEETRPGKANGGELPGAQPTGSARPAAPRCVRAGCSSAGGAMPSLRARGAPAQDAADQSPLRKPLLPSDCGHLAEQNVLQILKRELPS